MSFVRSSRVLVLATLLALAPAIVRAQATIIPLPFETAPDTVTPLTIDAAVNDRFSVEQHRGTHVDSLAYDASFVSALRPTEARGRPAGSAIRFDGERRTLEFAMFVPDPRQMRALRVSTLSSINVLPERSYFRVFVNGTPVGESRLENFEEFGTVEFPIGASVVLPGQNHVRIQLIQYHRIYCGPDASFALWSDIDLANSGAVLNADTELSGSDGFMMGIAAAAATGSGIEIRGTERLEDYSDEWVSQITTRISEALGGDPIPFRFTNYWSVVGEQRSAARITFLPSSYNRVTFRRSGDGAQVMVVEFVPGERPHPLPELENGLPRVAERAQPLLIPTQRAVAFGEFGFETTEVFDRYTRIEQRFRLPDDFVVLTNAKAEIRIDYGFVDNLPRGSMLLVNVNDENIRLLPLDIGGGELIEQFPLRFEARHLMSGINSVSFEAIVPGDPADLPCPTNNTPLLMIGNGTSINVPYSPSMYLPDMHVAFTGLTPESVHMNEMSGRSFDHNDVVTLRAALSSDDRPEIRSLGARLHLLSLEDLGAVPLGGYQFSRRVIENALTGADAYEAAQDTPDHVLFRATGGQESAALLTRGWEWLSTGFEQLLQLVHPHTGLLLEQWLSEQRGQAILLQLDPEQPDAIWMMRAPGSDIRSIASAIVAARTVSDGPRGQVSVLDFEGNWNNWTAPDRQPILLETLTPSNFRAVVGNFVSAMPIRYVSGLFFIALISAIFALRLVIATREHKE